MRSLISNARGVIAAGALGMLPSACIPYAVATTAEPIAPREHLTTMSVTVMPSVAWLDSTRGQSFLGMDSETRVGIDSVSDAGFRIVSASGVVVNYKRVIGRNDTTGLIAIMPGFGFVNLGQHAHFELTLLASGRMRARDSSTRGTRLVPYGGLRVMQVAPLNEHAVHDQPTMGGFIGVRIGTPGLGVSPELGVFYDHSALRVRSNQIVVVPTMAVHGDELLDFLRAPRRRPRPRPVPLDPGRGVTRPRH